MRSPFGPPDRPDRVDDFVQVALADGTQATLKRYRNPYHESRCLYYFVEDR